MEISDLSNAERETHLNMTADDRSTWAVYTDDPVLINRLDKIAHGTPHGVGMKYTLDKSQVTLRKRRVISEKKRAELRKRARENFAHGNTGSASAQNGQS